ncbi:MAG: hypothetical protein H6599_08720 [Flavobacteriales bacterium]|nr:hypothetical protein [Flavobacteriales bacterium]
MNIPIIYIPKTKFKKYICIDKRYDCAKEIIPIGSDCHPAYTLQSLHLRKHSLPFDWLNTNPIKGLDFVHKNIQTSFSLFLDGLHKNERDHVVSKEYPFAEFMHEKNLIENKLDQDKFVRRIKRLQDIIQCECYFLYTIPSKSLKTEFEINEFYNSVISFESELNDKQQLCIYIRYDEHFNENEANCNALLEMIIKYLKSIRLNIFEKKKKKVFGAMKKNTLHYIRH